jgi:mannan endo-1,4-beta-mannosidase
MKELLLTICLCYLGYSVFAKDSKSNLNLIMVNRSPKTQQLWEKLYHISYHTPESKTILGLQNAYVEGKNWITNFNNPPTPLLPTSDVEKISQHKIKLVGYDFDEIGQWNEKHIREWIKEHDRLGGITTLSWHMKNPTFGHATNSSHYTSPMAIRNIFTNLNIQQKFNDELNRLVKFLQQLSDIPIIFRPFHEHNENWFWWGKENNDVYWYKHLWQYTIDYLRANHINNILIAYSPNKITTDYLERYPGHDYVDILGTDYYFTTDHLGYELEQWKEDVLTLQRYAKNFNKIPAITEFGNEGILLSNFWTDYLAWPIQKEGIKQLLDIKKTQHDPINFAYVMLWRNAFERENHFFAPYPGHPQNYNFFQLLNKNFLIFIP